MKILPLIALSTLVASPALSEGARHADAHEHGVGKLNIAIEDQNIAMEFHAPGADIVGFEYEATTAEDLAAIDAGIEVLHTALDLFVFPEAAGCRVIDAEAELEGEEDHDDENHDDHGHDKHDDDHDDHHEEQEDGGHTEFHAEYLLTCEDISKANTISFAYFETFPNALEVEVQVISQKGASVFEVEREDPTLDLSDLF